MLRSATTYLLLIITLLLTGFSYHGLRSTTEKLSEEQQKDREVLYLPSGEGLEVMSFGFKNTLSHILWFNAISYFGKHYKGDQHYRWLSHMCELVTNLNPGAKHVFFFCANMLSWEAKTPELSDKILSKGMQHNPDDWLFYYLRGFTRMYFLENPKGALDDFTAGSKLPEAPLVLKQLSAKKMATLNEPEAAEQFLIEMIENSKDETEKSALKNRLLEVRHERNIQTLEKALNAYQQHFGKAAESLDAVVEAGILNHLDQDPWGGLYYIDPQKREIRSTSNKKRLQKVRFNKQF